MGVVKKLVGNFSEEALKIINGADFGKAGSEAFQKGVTEISSRLNVKKNVAENILNVRKEGQLDSNFNALSIKQIGEKTLSNINNYVKGATRTTTGNASGVMPKGDTARWNRLQESKNEDVQKFLKTQQDIRDNVSSNAITPAGRARFAARHAAKHGDKELRAQLNARSVRRANQYYTFTHEDTLETARNNMMAEGYSSSEAFDESVGQMVRDSKIESNRQRAQALRDKWQGNSRASNYHEIAQEKMAKEDTLSLSRHKEGSRSDGRRTRYERRMAHSNRMDEQARRAERWKEEHPGEVSSGNKSVEQQSGAAGSATRAAESDVERASEKIPSAFEKFESEVKTGKASKGWFGGPKTAEARVANAKANYKSVKEGAEGMTGEKLEKYLAEQGERLGTKFEGSNWAEREKSYYDNLSRDPSFGDYMTGNQVYGKAAGVGVAALAASAVMGDGRRSNAQLYSSPF